MIKIRTLLRKAPILAVTGAYTALYSAVYRNIPTQSALKVYGLVPPKVALGVIGLLTLNMIILIAFVINLKKNLKLQLKPKFNILWDSELEPYCPKCEKLLKCIADPLKNNPIMPAFPPMFLAKSSFMCSGCSEKYQLVDDTGKILNLDEARKILKA